MSIFSVEPLRQAFLTLPKQPRESDVEPIKKHSLYLPFTHAKALHPDNMLIEGLYGAGKSEYFLQLKTPEHLKYIATVLPRSELENTDCFIGFGGNDYYAKKTDLIQLLKDNIDAETIFNAITTLIFYGYEVSISWQEMITTYKNESSRFESELRNLDQQLSSYNQKRVILFDALELMTENKQDLAKLLKGLFQVCLKFRSFRALRVKVFVRPDMLKDESIFSFSGGAKISNSKVSLEWSKTELFNLLWQYLGNAGQGGKEFRDNCHLHFNQEWKFNADFNVWLIPESMRKDEKLQRKIFHALVGSWMGEDAKTGDTYDWLPNHLEDTKGKINPSSFLAALHEAANIDLAENQEYPLHYLAIKQGVRKASKMQVEVLNEKYHWINQLLQGQEVSFPCELEDIKSLWYRFRDNNDVGIPTFSSVEDAIEKLIDLGIFQPMYDGRINMSDVYRVGYGLGRKGGISPVK